MTPPAAVAAPFLKWAGGKGKLAPEILARAPARFGRYHEPFAGGGAVFFALAAARPAMPATLTDANASLIEAYRTVRDDTGALIAELRTLEHAYLSLPPAERAARYYTVRAVEPVTPVARAARLIFLNRTCYNGLYRVNRGGRFNVPHGRYRNPRILHEAGLRACATALQGVDLCAGDFAEACARARPGDFVYLDPPYQPLSATAHFTAYTEGAFGPADQLRLRDAFDDLTRRGVAAVLSNSDHEHVAALYGGRGYRSATVAMSRAINSNTTRRAPVAELLIDNLGSLAGSRGPAPR